MSEYAVVNPATWETVARYDGADRTRGPHAYVGSSGIACGTR